MTSDSFCVSLKVSRRMRSKITMLTHFSKRYDTLGFVDEILAEANAIFAFDFMCVTRNSRAHFSAIKPMLNVIFKSKIMDNEEKREKRERRGKRELSEEDESPSKYSQKS